MTYDQASAEELKSFTGIKFKGFFETKLIFVAPAERDKHSFNEKSNGAFFRVVATLIERRRRHRRCRHEERRYKQENNICCLRGGFSSSINNNSNNNSNNDISSIFKSSM